MFKFVPFLGVFFLRFFGLFSRARDVVDAVEMATEDSRVVGLVGRSVGEL